MPSHACLSCLDKFAATDLYFAGDTRPRRGSRRRNGAGCSSNASACAHRFCRPCLLTYVSGALRQGTFPVPCPMGPAACGHVFDRSNLLELLGKDHGELLQVGCIRCASRPVVARTPSARLPLSWLSCALVRTGVL